MYKFRVLPQGVPTFSIWQRYQHAPAVAVRCVNQLQWFFTEILRKLKWIESPKAHKDPIAILPPQLPATPKIKLRYSHRLSTYQPPICFETPSYENSSWPSAFLFNHGNSMGFPVRYQDQVQGLLGKAGGYSPKRLEFQNPKKTLGC